MAATRDGGVAVWVDRAVLLVGTVTAAVAIAFLSSAGHYYLLPLWERPDSPLHGALRPSGNVGHLLGIVGTAMVVIGVMLYSSRKRIPALQRRGPMRTWLNVHIYLCLTGPLLITLHSAMKFAGLGAYSYWSMMIVAGSGVLGRWLYQQFPRTIKGRELSLAEMTQEQADAHALLAQVYGGAPLALKLADDFADRRIGWLRGVHGPLTLPLLFADDAARPFRLAALGARLHRIGHLPRAEVRAVVGLVKERVTLARRLAFLALFRRLFLYWHVTHLIFFVAMFVLLVLHVVAAVMFGAVG